MRRTGICTKMRWRGSANSTGEYSRSSMPDISHLNAHVRIRASKIKLLLMDVDGVMTNGKLYHLPDDEGNMIEMKGFDSQDGIALQWMQWKGLRTGVISGRESLGTVERARQLKMNYVYQGHIEKVPILEEIMTDADLRPDEVAYMGDDFTDLVVMRRV